MGEYDDEFDGINDDFDEDIDDFDDEGTMGNYGGYDDDDYQNPDYEYEEE